MVPCEWSAGFSLHSAAGLLTGRIFLLIAVL